MRDFLHRWEHRKAEFARFGVTVNGAAIVEEFLHDLHAVLRQEASEALTIGQAAARSGYSSDHIGRMLRTGALENVGKRGRPRVRAGDLPSKARKDLQLGTTNAQISGRRRIALSVTNSNERSA